MSPDIFQKALLATARVACCVTLFSCTQHSEPAKTKTTDTPNVSVSPPVTQASSAKAPESAPVSAPSTAPSLADCQAHVQSVFVAKTTPQSELTKECCQKVAESIGFEGTSTWKERSQCCSVLDWNSSIACTPWGPPMPPAMLS
jgi:hypothetical protein